MVAPYCPERGDVIWMDFDPQSGREMMKRRPALVLTPKAFNAQSGVCFVCPVTSKIKGRRFEVALAALDVPSTVLSGNVHTFDWRTRNAAYITKAPDDVLQTVCANLAALLMIA